MWLFTWKQSYEGFRIKNRNKEQKSVLIYLKYTMLKADFKHLVNSQWMWWAKLSHMVKWPFYGLLLPDLNNTVRLSNTIWLLQCVYFRASPKNEKSRGWIFFILYPGIIVYVVWLFCRDYKHEKLVLAPGRELVETSMSNRDLVTAKSERSFKWFIKHTPVFMNTCYCGHVDWNFINIYVKQLITINTYYPKEVFNSSYYMLDDKTTASLMPLQYSTFDFFAPKTCH